MRREREHHQAEGLQVEGDGGLHAGNPVDADWHDLLRRRTDDLLQLRNGEVEWTLGSDEAEPLERNAWLRRL